MATNTRPELSDKNQWWISKHRYYELKHFCLQYGEWLDLYMNFTGIPPSSPYAKERIDNGKYRDPTSDQAIMISNLHDKLVMVMKAAFEACDHQFWYHILLSAVTNNESYDVLEAKTGIMPVSRNEWYVLYRKFFWHLDKLRD